MRNGRTGYEGEREGSGMFTGLAWMLGGLGVGAGLLYFLDPQSGPRRRQRVMEGARRAAASAGDYAGQAYDSARGYVGSTIQGARDWAADRVEDSREYVNTSMGGKSRLGHRIGMTICSLSSMALGAALMYIFDPQLGPKRRRQAQQQFREYGQRAGEAIRSGAQQVSQGVQNVAGQVAGATGLGGGRQNQPESEDQPVPQM